MNEFERAELEAENDGFTNDYQRAAFVSSLRRAPSCRVKALSLVQDGLHVAVEFSPEYCPITDALLGEQCVILASGPDRDAVRAEAEKHYCPMSDARVEIWPLHREPKILVEPDNDDIPF